MSFQLTKLSLVLPFCGTSGLVLTLASFVTLRVPVKTSFGEGGPPSREFTMSSTTPAPPRTTALPTVRAAAPPAPLRKLLLPIVPGLLWGVDFDPFLVQRQPLGVCFKTPSVSPPGSLIN